MSGSLLDEGSEISREASIRELTKALIDGFYSKTHLRSTTDLTPEMIGLTTRVKAKKQLIKDSFHEDIKLYDMVIEDLELGYRSKNRMGRTEGINALSMHIIQAVTTKMQSLLDRAVGG